MVSSCDRNLRRRREHDWSNIAADLLEYIQTMLPFPDTLQCRFVCRWWRSATRTHLSSSLNPPPPPSPPLISFRDDDSRLWRSIDVRRTERGNLMGDCVGYSHGYFLFSDRKNKYEYEETLFLFHPTLFSGSTLCFPPIRCSKRVRSRGGSCGITKAIMWSDPIFGNNTGSYGIVLIHQGSRQLLFAKCGATRFTQLERQNNMGNYDLFVDIICVKNCIYGITRGSNGSRHYIQAWDCLNSTIQDYGIPKEILKFKPRFNSGFDPTLMSTTYLRLVESQGEILLVALGQGGYSGSTMVKSFGKVYKMDFEEKEWVQMSSLGDHMVCIMEHQVMSLSSHEYPQYKRNSIQYFQRYLYSKKNYIYNMEDGSIEEI